MLGVYASFSTFWVQCHIFSFVIAINKIIADLFQDLLYCKNQTQALQLQQEAQAGEVANFAGLINPQSPYST